jgi:lysyl-tRNA synthetase class 2
VDGDQVRVGGRLRRSGDRALVADAFVAVEVQPPPALEDGRLVVIDGSLVGGKLVNVAMVASHAGHPGSDVVRFGELGVGAALRARARALGSVRAYFAKHDFLEVETPSLVPCPGLDLHLDAFEALDASIAGAPVALAQGRRFLATSPEYQMKRLLVGGVPRSFQLARAFRAGEVGAQHNPEFTMLEWYRAFATADDVIHDTEAVFLAVFDALSTERGSRGEAGIDLTRPFRRFSVAEAFEEFAGLDEGRMLHLANADPERFFRVLIDEVEPEIHAIPAPVVLHRYPAAMASLARLCPDDARYAERFEVYAGGLEISNGFGELTDPTEQRARFEHDVAERERVSKSTYAIDERFLSSLEQGMPPSAGNALGLDRLLMLALGKRTIADVLAFPEGVL